MTDSHAQIGVIEWSDPPPVQARRPRGIENRPWSLIAHELRSRPGEWGLICEAAGHPSLVSRINGGVSWWGPAGSFEAVSRQIDGSLAIWARYVGQASPPAS